MVAAELGLDPWDVFHQGLAETLGLRLGVAVVGTSLVVLLLWVPLRQPPGIGTLANAVAVGVVFEASIAVLPVVERLAPRLGLLAAAVVLNAIGTGLYIGAGLGPGPRDGLMTGLAARGLPLRVVRTGIEVAVLVVGWLLGGTVGIGTVVYALGIGPLVHITLPLFTIPTAEDPEPVTP
ncbi:MAG: hypothetical protein AAGA65_22965 [Actinomycetota bacterium]